MARTRPQHQPRGQGPVAAYRLKRRMSRRALADGIRAVSGLDVHPNTIGQVEAGKSGTRIEVIVAWAEALGVPLKSLVTAIQEARAQFLRAHGAAA